MSERFNPYYSPERFGLDIISFDEPDLSYEYNTLCFWATKDGQIYTAQDSGCSCPTPFENYDSENLEELLPKLERVGSVEQTEAIFNAWNSGRNEEFGEKYNPDSDLKELIEWVTVRLKV